MNNPLPRKTMRDVKSSMVGASFRRVHQDGRVTFARATRTLGQLPNPTVLHAKARRAEAT